MRLRYRVTEVLEEPTPWGAAYLAEDLEQEGELRIARVLNVPPQRQGLEARLQAVRDSVTTVRLEADPHLPQIVDFFEEGKKEGKKDGKRTMWVIVERPAGLNADALVAESRGGLRPTLGPKVARGLAQAFQALLENGQKQALAGVDSRHVYIDDDGEVQIADLALVLFLRPGSISWHTPASVPDPQPAALQKYGALMFGLLTGKPHVEGAEFTATDLPATLRDIIPRALQRTRPDAYTTFDELLADLKALPSEDGAAAEPAQTVSAKAAEPAAAVEASPTQSQPTPAPAAVPAAQPRPQSEARPATRGNLGVLGPGDLLNERYKVLEMLEAPSLWGAMYIVADVQAPTIQLVARQMNIPPLRQELQERVDAVRTSVALLRENPDPTRPSIVDFFEDGQKMWLVTKKVAGTDVETLVKTRKTITKSDWRARVALRLVQAIQSLYELDQRQAIADLTSRKVVLTTDARVFIVNYGLGLFLRPGPVNYHRADAVPKPETLALKRFGEIMYGLLTGELYHEGQVIVDADLPEGLGYVVLRALIPTRQDAYRSLDHLLSDLQVLQNIVEHEKMDVLHWEDFELPKEQPPVWDQIGIPQFLLRTAVVWGRSFREFFFSQSRTAIALQTLLCVLLLGIWAHDLYVQHHMPRDYKKSGPAVYLADKRGAIQVWDAYEHHVATTIELAHPVGDFFYSKRTQRLYVSVPAEKAIDMYYPGEASLLGETKVAGGTGRLCSMGQTAMLATLAPDGNLSQVNLRTLTSLPAVRLAETPVDLAWAESRGALLFVKDGPPRIEAYSKLDEKSVGEESLELPPKLLRLTPDSREAWVATTSAEGILLVVDPQTLMTTHKVELGRGHVIDILFLGDSVYLLLAEGELLTVDRATYKLVGRSVTVARTPVCVVQALPRELWIVATDHRMTIFNIDSGRTEEIPLSVDPQAAVAIP